MRRKLVVYPLISALLLLAMIVPATAAQFAPAIFAIDQDVVDGAVTVTRVTSNAPGWVVIHADADGSPGPVLGQAPIPSGISADVVVGIDTEGVTDTLWAMLHVDEGVEGEYEFPGPDAPVTVDDEIVMHPFVIGGVAQSIAGTAAATEGFSALVQAVEAAGLTDTLKNDGPFTLFAPTDEAFAALPAETLDALLADPEALSQVLLYHVVPGATLSGDITDGMSVETVQGSPLTLTVTADGVQVNGANVTAADIEAYNGVIHVIDAVLLPPVEEAPAEEAAAEESSEAEASEAVTETVAMTDTAAMTATAAMTETEVAAAAAMTTTESMTDTAATTETSALTDTAALTDTGAMTETEAVTASESMTETPAVEESAAVTATESAAAATDEAPAEEAATDEAAAEAPAPVTLPVTGGGYSAAAGQLPVLFVVVGILLAAAVVTRRRAE